MLCIHLEETDPCFCLAAEEFLLKNYREEIFMLWQSPDTVVVGKHQNTLAEIDYRYVRENGIRVTRRISGGGTVFHDSGNVNFTIIQNVTDPREISFQKFTLPIVEALHGLGINAETSGHNDLLIEGKKISGNAEHIFKNRVLHHGTLLFDSDLIRLGNAIRVTPGKYSGKAVRSNYSAVTNISGYLRQPMTIHGFIRHLLEFRCADPSGSRLYRIPEEHKEEIRRLSSQKFETREWKYGYSPHYSFHQTVKVGVYDLHIFLEVEKGIIRKASLAGDLYSPEETSRIETLLINRPHTYSGIEEACLLAGVELSKEIVYSYF